MRKGINMASENKKRKSKNSFLYEGGEKTDLKIKRLMFFNKRLRKKLKNIEED